MLELTYEELLIVQTGLNKIALLSEDKDSKIEFKIKWRGSRIVKKFQPELQSYTEIRQELLKKYGTEIFIENKEKFDENKKPILESTGQYNLGKNTEIYNTEIKKLLKEKVTLEGSVYKFKLSELKDIPGLSQNDYVSLDPILEIDVDVDYNPTELDKTQ